MDRWERKDAKQIATRVVRSIVGTPELKYFQNTNSGTFTSTGTAAAFGVAQGITGQLRLGNQIRYRSVILRYYLLNNVNNSSAVLARVIYGLDFENAGTGPTSAQILEDVSTPQLTITSPLNLSTTRGRFKILYDKTHVLGAAHDNAMNAAPNSLVFRRVFFKLGITQEYSNTGAGNTLGPTPFFIILSDRTGGADQPTGTWASRHRFTDV